MNMLSLFQSFRRRDCQLHGWSQGGELGHHVLADGDFATKCAAKQTGYVFYKSNEGALACVTERSFIRLPEVTKPVLSESGNLYLALQMVRYGLCLGALQFRLRCVLFHARTVDVHEAAVQVLSRSVS